MSGYHIREALRGLGFLVCIAGLVLVVQRCTGCKPAPAGSLPAYCTEEALYTAKLLRCVDDAKTLAESQQCRANVDYSCGIVQTITVKK